MTENNRRDKLNSLHVLHGLSHIFYLKLLFISIDNLLSEELTLRTFRNLEDI